MWVAVDDPFTDLSGIQPQTTVINKESPLASGLLLSIYNSQADSVAGPRNALNPASSFLHTAKPTAATIGVQPYFSASQYGYVYLPLSSYRSITLSCWFWWNAYANDDLVLVEHSPSTNSNAGLVIFPNSSSGGGGYFEVAIRDSSAVLYNQALFSRPTVQQWHHLAAMVDRNRTSAQITNIYIDGKPISFTTALNQITSVSNFGDFNLYLMSRNAASLFGTGYLAHLNVHGRALLPSEIVSLYENPRALLANI